MSGFSIRYAAPIIGLAIGLSLGLLYTWVIEPVELINTYPALLRTDYRRDWVRLAALSYVADGDLERTRARLDGIAQNDIINVMQALIEEYAAAGHSAETLRSLTTLAQALGVHTPAMLVYLDTPASSSLAPTHTPPPPSPPAPSPTPFPTPSPTPSPPPSPTPTPPPRTAPPSPSPTLATPEHTSTPPPPTPTPSLLSRLHVAELEQICQSGQREHIAVVVQDERGRGLAGVEVWLMWSGGADRAVTGLKPRDGAGYADFNAERGVSYSLGISQLGRPLVTALRLEPCPVEEGQESMIGSWRIVLEPRSPETG
jgi:hypothetical protein